MSDQSIDLSVHERSGPEWGHFVDPLGYDVPRSGSESYIDVFLGGDPDNKLPLGKERTHCFCDLAFFRWVLKDKLAWNERPLSKEHEQLRRNYDACTLDEVLDLTMDIILSYNIRRDLTELMAGSKMWKDDFQSLRDEMAACNDPRDQITLTKLEIIIDFLTEANESDRREGITDLGRLTNSFAIVAMFRSFKTEGPMDWDIDISSLIYTLEYRVKTEYLHKAAESPNNIWPRDHQMGQLINHLSTDYSADVRYEPDYLDRLLRLRPKLDELEDFKHLEDVDGFIDMLETAQVRQFTDIAEFDLTAERLSRIRPGYREFSFLSFLLLDKVFGLVQAPSVRDAIGYTFHTIEDVAETLIQTLCNYDIEDDLEHTMSALRRLRLWVHLCEAPPSHTRPTILPKSMQKFIADLPSVDRYETELRQIAKQSKADRALLNFGEIALCSESYGREQAGWASDAAAYLVLLNAKAESKTIFPTPQIKRDLDIDHELRIMPPILRSYFPEEVSASPALYYHTKATMKRLQLQNESKELVADVRSVLSMMEQCPSVQTSLTNRKKQKLQFKKDDRIANSRLPAQTDLKGWNHNISLLIFLFRRKIAQVPRKAIWSTVPGASFLVNTEIQHTLKILLDYDDTAIHDGKRYLVQLEAIRERLLEFEYVPEWDRLNELIGKIGGTGKF